ncbi:hypothetical protein CCR75_007064 [Bremia lactucae]|uniref:Uncharacterized protein n=1 Tax=Bremia lactucae TaxID=4779 RepID=A0A976IJV0_BRELC|nr:hypothetical protein CCR75_007064 [Bremia lactucae]
MGLASEPMLASAGAVEKQHCFCAICKLTTCQSKNIAYKVTRRSRQRRWFSGKISRCQRDAPGSIPGRRRQMGQKICTGFGLDL